MTDNSRASLIIPVFARRQPAQTRMKFEVCETTIADIHRAIRSGKITCRELVESYLKRIEAYDQATRHRRPPEKFPPLENR